MDLAIDHIHFVHEDDRMIEVMKCIHELFGFDNIQEIKVNRVGDNVSFCVKGDDGIEMMSIDLFDLELM